MDALVEHTHASSTSASVVLDIGGDVGALVVELSGDLLGRELDLTPIGASAPLVHTEVRERRLDGGTVFAAVYPAVPAGSYTVEGLAGIFVVEGGRVTETNGGRSFVS